MFKCFVCEKKYNAAHSVLGHLRFFHSTEIAQKRFICCWRHCVRVFNNFSAYSKHVKHHQSEISSMSSQLKYISSQALQDSNDDKNSTKPNISTCIKNENICSFNVELSEIDSSNDFDQALTDAVIHYVASLYDKFSLSEDEIQQIINCHKSLLGAGFLMILKKRILNLLNTAKKQENISDYDVNEIIRMVDSCQNMFNGFDSHYLRMKEFESCKAFIKPETYVIGTTLDERNSGGDIAIVPTLVNGQFIPLRSVLKGFLELPNVLKTILDYMKTLENESDVLYNIIQGKLWKEKIAPKFLGKIVLPLILYFDDYETNKELGTHTGVHKLGATYCKIACLPPEFQSSLENIFLVNLFHSSDKIFGNINVFRKVLTELKYLEDTGITVLTKDTITQVYFAMCLFAGDNLGANSILGYVESFSANYYCRVCKEHNKVTQKQTISNPLKRRNVENYNMDLKTANSTDTGIKTECIFNELKSFHVVENIHLDIMHDLDEGVWKKTMTCVINLLLQKKDLIWRA